MAADGPRYHMLSDVRVHSMEFIIRRVLRPGDRIVSVFPLTVTPNPSGHTTLAVLIELRHPSWAQEGIGWVAGDHGELPPG